MLTKKSFIISLFLVGLILTSNFIFVQADLGDLDELERKLEEFERLQEIGEIERWEMLGKRWKELLLQNRFVEGMHNVFSTIDGWQIFGISIFTLFLAENYDLSLTFFFSLIFFILFISIVYDITKYFLLFKKGSHILVSLFIAIILGQLGLYYWLSQATFGLLFYREGAWGWATTLIFFIIYITVIVIVKKYAKAISGIIKQWAKGKKEKQLEEKVERSERFRKGFEEGSKEGENF